MLWNSGGWGGGFTLVGKRYDSHFMERPLLLQEFNEAGDLPMELHYHSAENNRQEEGSYYTGK